MANPVLIAKLALVAADPKTWQKIIIACISIFIISAALLGSCGAMTFTDLGFDCSQLFSAKLNEYSAVFDSGARINDKLLYAVYAKIFADNDRLKNQTDELIDCFVSDDKLSPLTDSDEIFDKIERTFDLKINAYMRSQLLRLAEQMPTGYADRSTLIRNLKSSDGKTNIGLTNFAINALDAGSGYIYGAYGQDVTMAFLKQQQSRFFTDSDANLTNSEVNFIYETYGGKPAFDCIGLIKAYEWIDEDTGIIRYQSNGFRDVGADGMFRSAVIFGEISSIPDTPGLAVCMSGHIGIYIGNGEVIEAKSNHDGVVKTQLSEGSWTYWMQLPGITYLTGGTHPYGTKKVTLENGRIKEISAGIVAGKGEFEWPLPAPYGKDYITSGSGSRYNPVTGMYENSHGAIDIGAPAMTPIYAAADGTVVMSTWHDSYGNFVKIDHGNGWSTLYLIYQDKQGNIVFVCYDCFGRVKSAHKRGTNSAQRYRSFVTGGEFNCGFSYANDNATVLYVFEAPIDLMSFLTLHRHKPWHRASYLSLGGLSEDPLRRFLKEHKSIQRIAFCFDNDINKPENRGQEAAKRFMRQFSGKYITSILCPCKKDWNDVLRDKIQKGEFL